eukprot:Rmarinus@m.19964
MSNFRRTGFEIVARALDEDDPGKTTCSCWKGDNFVSCSDDKGVLRIYHVRQSSSGDSEVHLELSGAFKLLPVPYHNDDLQSAVRPLLRDSPWSYFEWIPRSIGTANEELLILHWQSNRLLYSMIPEKWRPTDPRRPRGVPAVEFCSFPNRILCFQIREDSKEVLCGCDSGMLHFLTVSDGAVRISIRGHNGGPITAAMYTTGMDFVSSSTDQKVVLWDGENGRMLRTFYTARPPITAFATLDLAWLRRSNPSPVIAGGSAEGSLYIWQSPNFLSLRSRNLEDVLNPEKRRKQIEKKAAEKKAQAEGKAASIRNTEGDKASEASAAAAKGGGEEKIKKGRPGKGDEKGKENAEKASVAGSEGGADKEDNPLAGTVEGELLEGDNDSLEVPKDQLGEFGRVLAVVDVQLSRSPVLAFAQPPRRHGEEVLRLVAACADGTVTVFSIKPVILEVEHQGLPIPVLDECEISYAGRVNMSSPVVSAAFGGPGRHVLMTATQSGELQVFGPQALGALTNAADFAGLEENAVPDPGREHSRTGNPTSQPLDSKAVTTAGPPAHRDSAAAPDKSTPPTQLEDYEPRRHLPRPVDLPKKSQRGSSAPQGEYARHAADGDHPQRNAVHQESTNRSSAVRESLEQPQTPPQPQPQPQ